ncbi:MAG: metallophosphoesterase [Oscillospiraceae bacterium]|nr:metallophosphoesterase [Oscillospiraceae bacterium]
MSKNKKKNKKVKIISASILIILLLIGLYNGLKIKNYMIKSEKITSPIRIVLVTDLHSCKYGEEEKNLIQAIEEQNPDIIALSGDIFDDKIPDNNTEYFLKGVAEKYPCYYVTGNHEYYAGWEAYYKKMEILEKYQVHVLNGMIENITIHGQDISICGVEDPVSSNFNKQFKQIQELLKNNNNYKILLSHRPELFEDYVTANFDLVLAGHAHGGQWRIPVILNGLYAPDQGLFPKFAGGFYQKENTTMIVSRGLARESTRIPRIYNQPELVVIDLESLD